MLSSLHACQALQEACPESPWSLTFSYGRALQSATLKVRLHGSMICALRAVVKDLNGTHMSYVCCSSAQQEMLLAGWAASKLQSVLEGLSHTLQMS